MNRVLCLPLRTSATSSGGRPLRRAGRVGALTAGSANTINCYIDRDIDAVMRRTSRRPLALPATLAVVKPLEALIFGIALGTAIFGALSIGGGCLGTALLHKFRVGIREVPVPAEEFAV